MKSAKKNRMSIRKATLLADYLVMAGCTMLGAAWIATGYMGFSLAPRLVATWKIVRDLKRRELERRFELRILD